MVTPVCDKMSPDMKPDDIFMNYEKLLKVLCKYSCRPPQVGLGIWMGKTKYVCQNMKIGIEELFLTKPTLFIKHNIYIYIIVLF